MYAQILRTSPLFWNPVVYRTSTAETVNKYDIDDFIGFLFDLSVSIFFHKYLQILFPMFSRFWFGFDSRFQIVLVVKAGFFEYQEIANNAMFPIVRLKKTVIKNRLRGYVCGRFFKRSWSNGLDRTYQMLPNKIRWQNWMRQMYFVFKGMTNSTRECRVDQNERVSLKLMFDNILMSMNLKCIV